MCMNDPHYTIFHKIITVHIIAYVHVHVSFSFENSSAGTEDHSSSTGQSSETGEGVTTQHGGGHGGQLLSQVLLSNC